MTTLPDGKRASETADLACAYDEVPYESGAFAFAHPARMAAIARLRGLPVAAPAACRYLEIGCALGQNLTPLALQYPEAHFVGVDLSARQIDHARAVATRLEVRNATFLARDIAEASDDLGGPFDYIICHGVFSWVTPAVREAILEKCHRLLAPSGVALISFNALPGGSALSEARRLALRLTAGERDLGGKVRAARLLFARLVEVDETLMSGRMRAALQALLDGQDSYLAHEYFAPVNDALAIDAVLSLAEQHGLQLLANAMLSEEGWRQTLVRTSGLDAHELTVPEREATLDSLADTAFRWLLLCRSEAVTSPDWHVEALSGLAAGMEPGTRIESQTDGSLPTLKVTAATGREVRLLLGAAIGVAKALSAAAPQYVAVHDLVSGLGAAERRIAEHALLSLAFGGAVDLITDPLPIKPRGELPALWSWAAHCRDRASPWFCGVRHQSVRLNRDVLRLLRMIDGQTPVAELRRRWNDNLRQHDQTDERSREVPQGDASPESFDTMFECLHANGVFR